MPVTLSGIVTLVKPLQPENAKDPMLVTEYPPNMGGIAIAPDVDVETAVDDGDPPPTMAQPYSTV